MDGDYDAEIMSFLQVMNLTFNHNNMELAHLGMEATSMLTSSPDAHAQVCLLSSLHVTFDFIYPLELSISAMLDDVQKYYFVGN